MEKAKAGHIPASLYHTEIPPVREETHGPTHPILPCWKMSCYLHINRNYSEIVQVNKKFNIPLKSAMTRVRRVDCDFNRITLYLINQSDSNSFPETASYLADILKVILRRTSAYQTSKWHVKLGPVTFYMIIKVPKTKKMESQITQAICCPVGIRQVRPRRTTNLKTALKTQYGDLTARVLGSSSSLGHF